MLSTRLIACTLLGSAAWLVQLLALAAPQAVIQKSAAKHSAAELACWQASARRVTIMRDKWGIPHVFGKTDADAVFGLLYAQAEDDFNRVELNYINALGRLAEVEGEAEIWRDLRMKLFITPRNLQARFAASPAWLRQLMVGFADGLNFYLHVHPEVRPKLLTRFEPWMALAFSEGSIGGDIESIDLGQLEQMYGKRSKHKESEGPNADISGAPLAQAAEQAGARLDPRPDPEPRSSNGFAIAPRRSASGHALLLINPHTSFYFRPEVHMVSEQGLNAYGAVTWGQFFVYQGFNERAGWMHTSGGGDVIDEYLETVLEKDGSLFYRYGAGQRPMRAVPVTLAYKTAGGMASKTVTAYFTHHGPVVREAGGKWVSVKLMAEPLQALTQSFARTRATGYAAFYKTMQLRTNSSNNTVYADVAAGAAARNGKAGGGLRHLANAMGRNQSLPAHQWRRRPAVRRQRTELPGRVHVGHLGLAGLVRHGRQTEDQAHLRRPRQQLRGGRRIRSAPARQEHPGRRPKRQSGFEALQRPGRDVQQGPVQGCAVLQGRYRKIS